MFKRVALVLSIALILAGCYETTVPLGSPEQAKVDRNLAGDWSFPAAGDQKAVSLVLRNLDDKQYYVEWQEAGEKPARCVGIVVPIKDAMFAQVRNLPDDGSIADKHLIVRVSFKDNKLGIRQLNDKFFDGKAVDTTEKLRAVLEANLENADMYDGDYRMGTKQAAEKPAGN